MSCARGGNCCRSGIGLSPIKIVIWEQMKMIMFLCAMENEPNDREFMVHLYTDFERLLFYTARQYVSAPEAVEDIVQESIVKLCEKIQTLKSMNKIVLAAYIRATVRNTAINALKEMGYEKEHLADKKCDTEAAVDQQFFPDAVMDLARYRELLSKVWPKLSREDQILLEGKYILGYNDYELAKEIGCKPGSIRMKLTRARRHALTIIRDQEGVNHFDEA